MTICILYIQIKYIDRLASVIVTIYMYTTTQQHILTNFMQKDPQLYVLLPDVHININNIINLLFIFGFCGVSWDMEGVYYSIQLLRTEESLGWNEQNTTQLKVLMNLFTTCIGI